MVAVEEGCSNLGRHIENMKSFGVPVVVAINHFVKDTNPEVAAISDYVKSVGSEAVLCKHWEQGSEGTIDLAKRVVDLANSKEGKFNFLYEDSLPLLDKIQIIAKRIYRAGEVVVSTAIKDQLVAWENAGYANLPVCMAKTQYSFSTDPNLRGAPKGHSIPIREVRLSAGAGFIVAICGDIMTMPGLPSKPAAENIMLNENDQIEGLF